MPVHGRDRCRAPNSSVPCPTGMPPRVAAPATPRSGVGSPRTRAAVVDRAPTRQTQTGTRTSGLEPRRDRSPRWRPHGCAGMSAKSAMAALGAGSGILRPSTRDLETELEKFTVDARGAPQWVLLAHPLDEFAQLTANSGPSWPTTRFPAPIGPKSCAMPPQDRVRLNDVGQTEQAWPEPSGNAHTAR